jgi:CheY-like chemotaxis protein
MKILLAEDNEMNRDMLSRRLKADDQARALAAGCDVFDTGLADLERPLGKIAAHGPDPAA